jgi:hypothetical protein
MPLNFMFRKLSRHSPQLQLLIEILNDSPDRQVLASQASQQRAEREAALERSQLSDSSGMPEQDAGAYLPKVSKTTNEDLSQSSAATPMDGHGEEVQETESDLEEVVKSLTLEEIKEIKKKRGRPSNADRDMKTKNSSVAKTTKQKKK